MSPRALGIAFQIALSAESVADNRISNRALKPNPDSFALTALVTFLRTYLGLADSVRRLKSASASRLWLVPDVFQQSVSGQTGARLASSVAKALEDKCGAEDSARTRPAYRVVRFRFGIEAGLEITSIW
jgi:hypothetical protein